ncbi:diguanylate cyclase domain-containing protein [Fusobacterium perfoetens]|uniref:diguanylate cyclase domain-containing protein n=1 Tax=Fusobacterium perfoetens TaxID=852 RepID=UPI001F2BF298|nr:diguanylate cyclase [Fusobacterium perfoetens]MCF2612457.1 GGDEF domain-containing protein [Fusobacterium perfoetens]
MKVYNLKGKIVSVIVGLIVFINAIVVISSFSKYQEKIKNKVLQNNMERIHELSSQIKNIIYKEIGHSSHILGTIIETENLEELTAEEVLKKLKGIENKGHFKSLGIIYSDGKTSDSDGHKWDIRDINLDDSLKNDKRYISDILVEDDTESSEILIAIPLNTKDGKTKALFGYFSISHFESLTNFSKDSRQYFQIVDTTGRYISSSNSSYSFSGKKGLLFWDEIERYRYFDGITVEKIKDDVENKRTGTYYFEYGDAGRYIIYDPLGIKNWYVFSALTREKLVFHTMEVKEISNEMLLVLIEFMIVIVSVILGIFYYTYKVIKNDSQIIAVKNRMFKMLLHKTEDIIFKVNLLERKVVVYNYYGKEEKQELTIPFDEIHPTKIEKFVVTKPEFFKVYDEIYNNITLGKSIENIVIPLKKKDSEWKWFRINSIIVDSQSTVGILENCTEEKIKEQELEIISKKSKYDFLTKLYNRENFEKEMNLFLNSDKELEGVSAFFIIDLDNFKKANDTFGHDMGDKILQESAAKIKLVAKDVGVFARFGGDEFALLVKEVSNIEKLNEIAQQLNDILNKTYIENNKSVTVGASIGGVIIKKDMNFKEIYKKADNALYRVKNSKKGSYFIDNN